MRNERSCDVSIVAACRNEFGHIHAFLNSILDQDMGQFTWEAVVADGMSTDGTREILDGYASQRSNIRVLSNHRLIVSTGLNAAIRAARGQIIIRMDAHTAYANDYCRSCIETLIRTGAHNVGGPARTRAQGMCARSIAAAYHSPFSTGGGHFHDPDFEGWVDTVPYGCWQRRTFDEIGLFDEGLVRNQDDELNLRLMRHGGRIWQSPAIRSWYSPRRTLPGLFHQYFQYGFWKVAVVRKHRIPSSWRHVVPVAFLAGNFVLAISVLFGVARHAGTLLAAAWMSWAALLSIYAVANATASLIAARREGWITLALLPVVFATYHLSYGLGFAAGLFGSAFCVRPLATDESVFARITR